MSSLIRKVLGVIAMEGEAKPIIEKLNLQKVDPKKFVGPAPCVGYTGKVGGLEVCLVHNAKCKEHSVDNICTVPTALITYLAAEFFKPDLLINAGTAGGFTAQGAEIGDVYLSTSCVFHDRRIPIPQYEAYGTGKKTSTSTEKLKAYLNIKNGVVTTGDSFNYTPTCMEIMKNNNASVKEMEAAAVAWTADLFNIPMFCLKAVTDVVDGDGKSEEDFFTNFQIATEALQQKFVSSLHFIDGKAITDL